VSSPKQKPASKEASFPKQKIEFDLLPGWRIVKKEEKADQATCVLTKEVDGTVMATVGIWAGENFATEAIAKGSVILFEGKKVAKGSPQESQAGNAGAIQKVMSLALGRDYQPGTIMIKSVDVGWKNSLFLAIQTKEGTLTGVGVFTGGAGGPLLVGWAFDEASEEETMQLVKRIFEARKPSE
jgi:hypothetical protein